MKIDDELKIILYVCAGLLLIFIASAYIITDGN
jgi:hypothetical protein